MNANPSGSRTPSTGCWGRIEARREFVVAGGPSSSLVRIEVCAAVCCRPDHELTGCGDGARCAKTVRRGALYLRCAAQGRVGDQNDPRHVARQLVPHLLLLAITSAPADAVRPHFLEQAGPWLATVARVRNAASRPKGQPAGWREPHDGARDTELVQAGHDVIPTSARAQSRGKGVLAA